jgi:hypothetical protein
MQENLDFKPGHLYRLLLSKCSLDRKYDTINNISFVHRLDYTVDSVKGISINKQPFITYGYISHMKDKTYMFVDQTDIKFTLGNKVKKNKAYLFFDLQDKMNVLVVRSPNYNGKLEIKNSFKEI